MVVRRTLGTSTSLSVYTSKSKVQGSSSSGRKVTEAVICRMIACISEVISFCDFSTFPSGPTDLSVCTSNTHRSSVSCVCCPVTTTTSFCTEPAASHSAARHGHVGPVRAGARRGTGWLDGRAASGAATGVEIG